MPHTRIVESDDAFEIDVRGLTVTQLRFDFALTVLLADNGTSIEIRISQPFDLGHVNGEGEGRIDPEERPPSGAPALSLLDEPGRRLVALKDGRLDLILGGWTVRVPAGTDYEAWTLNGPGKFMLVSTPGGDLAVWD